MDKKQWKKAGIGMAALGVAAAAIVVGNRTSVGQSPDLAVALEKLSQAESYRMAGGLRLNLPPRTDGINRPFNEVLVQLDGDVKRAEEGAAYEMAGQMHLEAKGEGNLMYTDGQAMFLEDRTVFKLEQLPALLSPGKRLAGKWVEVPTGVAQTNNPAEAYAAWQEAARQLGYQGQAEVSGRKVQVYRGSLTDETEGKLVSAWKQSASGNRALDVVARLLQANDVREIEAQVDAETTELVGLKAVFDRAGAEGSGPEFATLVLSFSGYGQPVAIERPEAQVRLEPKVFKDLFGAGELPSSQP